LQHIDFIEIVPPQNPAEEQHFLQIKMFCKINYLKNHNFYHIDFITNPSSA